MYLTQAYSRVAILSSQTIGRLIQRYRTSFTKDRVKEINSLCLKAEPQFGDLFTEWILKSISLGSGRIPEDWQRFMVTFRSYISYTRPLSPRFKAAVDRYNQEHGLHANPKNILDFTLHQLEDVITETNDPVDPRVNKLERNLPAGARMFYNDGSHQIIEVTEPQAACQLGRGTKWCTSNEAVATDYLSVSPLYIVYRNGKKFAQIHIGMDEEGEIIETPAQLMDLRDRPIVADEDLRIVLLKSGILERLEKELDPEIRGDIFTQFFGSSRFPEAEPIISRYPGLSYLYANEILRGRFPQGEPAIITEPYTAYLYATNILNKRWLEAESSISRDRTAWLYYVEYFPEASTRF